MARLVFPVVLLVTLLIGSSSLHAQRRVPGYANRSTISPYVNLFRANDGGLNSYFDYVRPRLQLDQFVRDTNAQTNMQMQFAQQQTLMLQQSMEEAIMNSSTQQLQTRPTPGAAFRRQAGSFMRYSPYFPQGQNSAMLRTAR
jgi:hypothetical protein